MAASYVSGDNPWAQPQYVAPDPVVSAVYSPPPAAEIPQAPDPGQMTTMGTPQQTDISAVLEAAGEIAPVSYPGERVDYSAYDADQLSQSEGSIQSLMGSNKSIGSYVSPYTGSLSEQYTGVGGLSNQSYGDQYAARPELLNTGRDIDAYKDFGALQQWAGQDYMYRTDEEGQKYTAAQTAMQKSMASGGTDYKARIARAKNAYAGTLGAASFDEASANLGAYATGVRDEVTTELNRAMLSGEQDKAHAEYATYQEDLRKRQELQNELMKSSPEYQVMQDSMKLQQESVDLQREELNAVRTQYEDLRNDFAAREKELGSYLEGLGATERTNLEQQREQLKAQEKERLMQSGLTSTSALSSAMRGIDYTTNQSLSELESRLRQQKLDYSAQFSGETLAAQERSAQFATSAAQANFASAQAVPQTMTELAQMLANQRTNQDSQRGQIAAAALQADASRYGSAMSASASAYASKLGYQSDIYGTQSQERTAGQQRNLDKWQTQQQTKLGYAGLENDLTRTKMQGDAQKQAAWMSNPWNMSGKAAGRGSQMKNLGGN